MGVGGIAEMSTVSAWRRRAVLWRGRILDNLSVELYIKLGMTAITIEMLCEGFVGNSKRQPAPVAAVTS